MIIENQHKLSFKKMFQEYEEQLVFLAYLIADASKTKLNKYFFFEITAARRLKFSTRCSS